MNLVIIPFHDWKKCEREGFRTRDAHFMQELEKQEQVSKLLVINRPISLAEIIIMRRNLRPRSGNLVFSKNGVYITQVGTKSYVLDILIWEVIRPLQMKRNWTPYIFGKEKVFEAVQTALNFLGVGSSYGLFTAAPIFTPLLQKLSPSVFAFDALDNFLKHSLYREMPNLDQYYDYCLQHADLVSANSLETTEWFQTRRPDAKHIANGVDVAMFDPSMNYVIPADMESLPKPIVGYAGKMQEMFDVPTMILTAKALPDVSFVFIGQQLDPHWMKELWPLPNVHYLGDKPYQLLPQYLAAFDICIIPYATERQHGGDPIKFYEYLSMQKPIVTAPIGNVIAFADYPQVQIASNGDEFAAKVGDFVKMIASGTPITMTAIPEKNLWRTKVEQLLSSMITIQEG